MPFDKLSLKELKEHAKQHKDLIKGYTKMGKADLVKTLNKHLKRDRSGAVSRKGDPSKTHPGDMDYTTKKGDKDYHEGGHDEQKKKRPFSTMTDEERRQWKMQYGDHSLLDMVKAGHSDPGTPKNPLPAGGRIQKCLDRIHKLKGGQLPSSVRERLEHLEVKLKGGTITSGRPKKRITPIAVKQTDAEKIQQKLQQERREEMDKRLEEKKKPAEIVQELRKGGPSKGEQTFHEVVDRLSANVLAAHEKDARVQKKQKEDHKKEQPKKSCPLTGYSKLKKAALIEKVGKALEGKSWRNLFPNGKYHENLDEALKYSTVPELRKLARKYCGYKERTPSEKKVEKYAKDENVFLKKDELEAAGALLDLKGTGVNKDDRCWKGYEPTPGKEPYSKGSCQKIEGGDIDFEDMKWGSFTEQFNAYNRQHKKKFKDLKEFADHIRANKDKFQPKTRKRADFYINVILKKKSNE